MKKKIIKSDLAILGSGPAGYTASIYSSRSNLSTILITGNHIGGQLTQTYKVENWPTEYNAIPGQTLMNNFYKHSTKLGTKIYKENIIKTILKRNPIKLYSEELIFETKALIIATGSKPKKLGIESEKKFEGRGISTCAICDGFFYKNKEVAIVGGGNSAIEEALHLSKMVKKIYLIHRRKKWKADKILVKRLLKKSKTHNIKIHLDCEVIEIFGNCSEVTGIVIISKKDRKKIKIAVSCLFISIGHVPETNLFKNDLEMENGYIKIKSGRHGNFTTTNVPGIFAAGDVTDHVYKQAITASASGCMAAIDASKYLETIKLKK
ncbi:thioredoxin-disulfide reductase [Buchnera aphidicola (Chaitoregma tattakana)]|uniref:thioredoxin-disulfide reductase n=1 Tax=Buchnera aphidicola TaxID=9 RepID=UPI0031B839B7